MNYNVEELRNLLKDYYGTAMFNGFPMAVIDLGKVDRMSDEEVIKEAIKYINSIGVEKIHEHEMSLKKYLIELTLIMKLILI